MFVAVADGEIVGVIESNRPEHINMVFVDGAYHRQGIATAMMEQMVCALKLRGSNQITINASPYGLPFYEHFGFRSTDDEQRKDGFIFTPMVYTMTENKDRWEALADDYDERVGIDGDDFHQKLIRPATVRLLNPKQGERILDIACGNGVFERYLAAQGVKVVAFDFSPSMIAHAKERCADYLERIDFSVADATDYDQLIALGGGKPFDKAVANMALMGFPQIEPLFRAVYEMLKPGGVFVFSATHPCFQTPGRGFTEDGNGLITYNYLEPMRYAYQILTTTDKRAYHWHRSLSELLSVAFPAGFVMDGMDEPVYGKGECTHPVWEKVPLPVVIRVRKVSRCQDE